MEEDFKMERRIRTHGEDLISINPIFDTFEDELYFLHLMDILYEGSSGRVYMKFREEAYIHPDLGYSVEDLVKYIKDDYKDLEIENFDFEERLEMKFSFKKKPNNKFLKLLPYIWEAFDQCVISLLKEDMILREKWHYSDLTDKYIYTIAKRIEEEVAWVNKDSNIEFPNSIFESVIVLKKLTKEEIRTNLESSLENIFKTFSSFPDKIKYFVTPRKFLFRKYMTKNRVVKYLYKKQGRIKCVNIKRLSTNSSEIVLEMNIIKRDFNKLEGTMSFVNL